MTLSSAVDAALMAAEAEGNSVFQISTGWEKVRQVVHMNLHMTPKLREKIGTVEGLTFFSDSGTPHNIAMEGFIDDVAKVGIVFPTMQGDTW